MVNEKDYWGNILQTVGHLSSFPCQSACIHTSYTYSNTCRIPVAFPQMVKTTKIDGRPRDNSPSYRTHKVGIQFGGGIKKWKSASVSRNYIIPQSSYYA